MKVTKWRPCLVPNADSRGYLLYLNIKFTVSSGGRVQTFFNKVGKLLLCKVLSISPNIFLQDNHARFSFTLLMLMWPVRPDIKSSWISGLNPSWTWCIMHFHTEIANISFGVFVPMFITGVRPHFYFFFFSILGQVFVANRNPEDKLKSPLCAIIISNDKDKSQFSKVIIGYVPIIHFSFFLIYFVCMLYIYMHNVHA